MTQFWLKDPLRDANDGTNQGGGGGNPPPNNAPPAVTMEAVNIAINNAVAGLKKTDLPKILIDHLKPVSDSLNSLKDLVEKGAKPPEGNPPPNNDGKPPVDPQLNATLQDLKKKNDTLAKQVEDLQNKNTAAEKKAEEADRNARVTALLSKFTFANERSQKIAFDFFSGQTKRADDGSLIAGDLPLDKFIEQEMAQMTNLLAPKQTGGAGAQPGTGTPGELTLDSIKPGMSPEQRNAVLSKLHSIAAQSR